MGIYRETLYAREYKEVIGIHFDSKTIQHTMIMKIFMEKTHINTQLMSLSQDEKKIYDEL